ncbi:MAG: helix-turn-helix domain-containing protein [Clostridia bacterium]|nr:helix-turn-helix domain-containing protein [Clostridia bacterium]
MKSTGFRLPLRRGVKLQIIAILLLFTVITTVLTGCLIYSLISRQVIRDAWQQHESLLNSACSSVNQQLEQLQSFSWQLNNHSGVSMYLRLKTQTPQNIIIKQKIIEQMQQMKAFSTTLSDIGIHAGGLDIIITAESSYRTEDYFSRISGITLEDMLAARKHNAAMVAFVGSGEISRILSTDRILVFVSSLPINSPNSSSYSFFHLSEQRMLDCLPQSGMGVILLADRQGNPLLSHDDERFGDISRKYMAQPNSRIKNETGEYGVLSVETASPGLYCMAVVPYHDLLAQAIRLRNVAMLVMGICVAGSLLAAVFVSKRFYAPLEHLLENVSQLCHTLPEEERTNEYKLLDDAIHLIMAENHELTLSNQEINRLLKNRLLIDWMEGRLKDSSLGILSKVNVSLPYNRVQIAAIQSSPRVLEYIEKGAGCTAADAVEAMAGHEEYGPMKVWCAQRQDGLVLILINLAAQHPTPENVYALLQRCRQELFDETTCTVGVGRAYSVENASDALVDAMLALRSGETMSGRSIYFAEEVPLVSDSEYSLAAEQKLINQMLGGQRKETEATLHALCAPKDGNPVPRTGLVQALLFTAWRMACHAGIEEQYAGILENAGFRSDRMPVDPDTAQRLCQVFMAVMDGLCSDVSTQEEKLYARLTEYIHSEYQKDISLDSASEALSMSLSYIGRVFRRVGNTSFLKYLTEVRISAAKQLLTTSDLPVNEIGRQVGIDNPNTLIRTFKKVVGVTPGQFRVANQKIDSQNG